MTVYFDSSALVAAYVTEAYSEAARREIRKQPCLPWTTLHDLEVKTALRLLHGRGEIDDDELVGLLGHIEDDLGKRRLVRPSLDLDAVFRRAGALSRRRASETLARTLDILHVAALMTIGCGTLVSADERQIAVALREGLAVVDIRNGE